MYQFFKNPTRANRIARAVGWVLLFVHFIYSLIPAASILGKRPGYDWWPVLFAIDFPASAPIFLIEGKIANEWILLLLFVATGSLWHFYWPQALVALGQSLLRIFRHARSRA